MRLAVLALFLTGLVGCGGSNRGAVEGSVTLDGTPIESGAITFRPTGETKGATAGGEIKNGRYAIPAESGPVVGTNRVEISAWKETGRMVSAALGDPNAGMKPEVVEAVAPRFNVDSELTVEIEPGRNTCDFRVEGR